MKAGLKVGSIPVSPINLIALRKVVRAGRSIAWEPGSRLLIWAGGAFGSTADSTSAGSGFKSCTALQLWISHGLSFLTFYKLRP